MYAISRYKKALIIDSCTQLHKESVKGASKHEILYNYVFVINRL